MQKIIPNIWFNRNAEEAVKLYMAVFPHSAVTKTTYYGKEGFEFHQMPEGTVLTMDFEVAGEKFVALNGGAEFPLNPAVSFMVMCKTGEEVDGLWHKLIEGGEVMMALDKYDWSPKYGFCKDHFGVSWQLYLADESYQGQHIVPTLMFTQEVCGRAEEAIRLYTSLFEESKIEGIMRSPVQVTVEPALVQHASFTIRGYSLMAMDSAGAHAFTFNESMSLIVSCENQDEVDKYWDGLVADGGAESQCGWLKDKFGMSWQIVPGRLIELLSDPDKEKASRVMQAMFHMKKIFVEELEAAANAV